ADVVAADIDDTAGVVDRVIRRRVQIPTQLEVRRRVVGLGVGRRGREDGHDEDAEQQDHDPDPTVQRPTGGSGWLPASHDVILSVGRPAPFCLASDGQGPTVNRSAPGVVEKAAATAGLSGTAIRTSPRRPRGSRIRHSPVPREVTVSRLSSRLSDPRNRRAAPAVWADWRNTTRYPSRASMSSPSASPVRSPGGWLKAHTAAKCLRPSRIRSMTRAWPWALAVRAWASSRSNAANRFGCRNSTCRENAA